MYIAQQIGTTPCLSQFKVIAVNSNDDGVDWDFPQAGRAD